MEIYLLRHGMSTSNELGLVCGAADYPLSDNGRDQADRVCACLGKIQFTKIYTSPLSRALQTIENLHCEININIENELIELNTGEVSHISVNELWAREPRYRYQGLYPDLKYPKGECLNDMLSRIGSWYDRVSASWSSDDVILISGHEGTVCGVLHHLMCLDISHYPTFQIGNCDFIQITVNQDDQVRYRFFPLQSLS